MYYGCLEDGTEVAVKMRSELSSHGLDEFLAEVLNSPRIKRDLRTLICLYLQVNVAQIYYFLCRRKM